MKQLMAIIPLVLLAACQSPASEKPQAPATAQTENQCGASSLQSLVGTQASGLEKSTLPKGTRIIHPDTVVTMDYSAHRLNVHVGKDGKISRVACG